MTRVILPFILLALLGFGQCRAADSAIAGKWNLTSNDGSGQEVPWTLVVSEQGGKLSGSLNGGMGEIPLLEPKLTGHTFTFKIHVNDNCTADVNLKIDGKNLSGNFACPEAKGTMKGTKQP